MSKIAEIGTLAELNVKPGDVVAWHSADDGFEDHDLRFSGVTDFVVYKGGWVYSDTADESFGPYSSHIFRIVSRASHIFRIVSRASQPETETPKLWRDMTPEEKGALLLAHHDGRVIESRDSLGWRLVYDPSWTPTVAYRVRPEPKRETVTLHGGWGYGWGFYQQHNRAANVTHAITFDLIDGKPDPASICMEELS